MLIIIFLGDKMNNEKQKMDLVNNIIEDMPEDLKKLMGIMKINKEYRDITNNLVKETIEILNKTDKPFLIKLFRDFINQKPNIDRHDYSSYSMLQNEYNKISKQKQKALAQLELFEILPLVKEVLAHSLVYAFSGRLRLKSNKEIYLDYCTGQYFPTEYRLAIYHVLDDYNARVKELMNKEVKT